MHFRFLSEITFHEYEKKTIEKKETGQIEEAGHVGFQYP